MTDQKKDRLIVEALGECWHEWGNPSMHDPEMLQTRICKICGKNNENDWIPKLATPEGFFWIWPRMQKMLWGAEFLEWWWMGSESVPKAFYLIAFNINPPRLRDSLAEFLEGRK